MIEHTGSLPGDAAFFDGVLVEAPKVLLGPGIVSLLLVQHALSRCWDIMWQMKPQ
jgi:hypothetical protein